MQNSVYFSAVHKEYQIKSVLKARKVKKELKIINVVINWREKSKTKNQ